MILPLSILGSLLAWDLFERRIPNWVVLTWLGCLTMNWIVGNNSIFFLGGLVGVILGMIAKFPGGDVKALMLLGLVIGVQEVSEVFAVAGILTLVQWRFGVAGGPWLGYLSAGWGIVMLIEGLIGVYQ